MFFYIYIIAVCRADHDVNNNLYWLFICLLPIFIVYVIGVRRPTIRADHDDNVFYYFNIF